MANDHLLVPICTFRKIVVDLPEYNIDKIKKRAMKVKGLRLQKPSHKHSFIQSFFIRGVKVLELVSVFDNEKRLCLDGNTKRSSQNSNK